MVIMSWGHRDTPRPRGNARFLSELQGCKVQLLTLVIKHAWDWSLALSPAGKKEHPSPLEERGCAQLACWEWSQDHDDLWTISGKCLTVLVGTAQRQGSAS